MILHKTRFFVCFSFIFLFISITDIFSFSVTITGTKNPNNPCTSDTVIFKVPEGSPFSNYNWQITDGFGTTLVSGNTSSVVLNGNIPQDIALYYNVTADSSGVPLQVIDQTGYVIKAPDINLGSSKSLCPGESVVLSNQAVTDPGDIYNWRRPNGTTVSGSTLTASNPGVYYLTVYNSLLVCKTTKSVQVNAFNKPTVNAESSTGKPFRCFGSGLLLNARIVVESFPQYRFRWTPAIYFNSDTLQNPTFSASIPINCKVVVTDANGCKDSSTIFIKNNPEMKIGILTSDTTLCKFDGIAINTTVAGGTPFNGSAKYTYLWTPTEGINNPTAKIPIVRAISFTGINYKVTASDSNNCTISDSILIKRNNLELAFINRPTDSIGICQGSKISLTFNRRGGREPYVFTWSPTSELIPTNDSNYTSKAIRQLTKFMVTVADGNGCTDKDSLITGIIPTPYPNIADKNKVVCENGAITIDASPATAGTYSYKWSPATDITDINVAAPVFGPTLNTSSRYYSVTVTGSGTGCSGIMDSILVVTKSLPQVSINRPEGLVFIYTVTGFTTSSDPSLSFVWNIEDYGVKTGSTISQAFEIPKAYNITLTGTDPFGCIGTDIYQLKVRRSQIPRPYIPTVFAPASTEPSNSSFKMFFEEGDILEDGFVLQIYNIYGQMIFKSNSAKEMRETGWNGGNHSAGVYTYTVRGKNNNDIDVVETGSVTLLK